jgi:conjugative transfer region protein (TIGR03748 family)
VNNRSRTPGTSGGQSLVAALLATAAMALASCASVGEPSPGDDSGTQLVPQVKVVQASPDSNAKPNEQAPQLSMPRSPTVDAEADAGQTQVGRYTVAAAQPPKDLANPLAVIATVSFPRGQVQTVGEALTYLLLRTGYRLDEARMNEPARHVLTLPLPESHRRLGPYRVEDIVRTLIGQAWTLQVDGMVRSVAFDVQQPSDSTKAVTAAR